MTNSQRTSIQVALLAFAAVLLTSVASFADTYTLTARTEPQQTGVNGLPEGKSYCDLTSSDTLTVTATGAQLYFNRSANLAVPITISGFGDGTGAYHSTGKFRMQNNGTVVNLNGLVTLAGDTFIGSHDPVGNQGTLNFNNQITGSGGLITCIGTNGYVHLNNTSQTNLNNYQGNTQLGYPEMYNYDSYRPYAGVVYLDANEQIPDALTAGSTATGNLILNSYTSNNQISKLYLGNHTETVNGLVSEDTGTALSIITGESGSKLTVGANDATASYSGLLQGAMQLEKIGTGTQTLSGANTYTGATTITDGTLKLTNSATMGTGIATVASGATVEMGTASNSTWAWGGGIINGAGTLKVTGGGKFEMSISKMKISNGSIIADGTHLTLSEASGAYHISGLNIDINNGGVVEFARSANSYFGLYFDNTLHINFDQNGGGTLNTGAKVNNSVYINLISNSQITFTTNGGAKNCITGTNGFNTHNYNLIFDVAKGTDASGVDLDVSARLWNGHGIVKKGAGTMALTSANPYTGATTVSAGTLKLSAENAISASGSVVNNAAITMGAAQTMNNLEGSGTIDNGGSLLTLNNSADTVFSGVISGSGGLENTGDKKQTLSGANTYSGGTTISAGTLVLSGNGTLGTGAVTVDSGATLEFAYDSPTHTVNVPSITMTTGSETTAGSNFKVTSGSVTFGTTDVTLSNLSGGILNPDGTTVNSTLTVTGVLTLNNDQLTKFIGSISAASIEKTGNGTMQIYTGAEGQVDALSLTVSSGRMDFKGYMTGGITVDAGGVFSPGNSVGEATFGGGYILKDGATLLIEQDATGIDKLNVGSFTFDETSISQNIQLDITGIPFGAEYEIISSETAFTDPLLDEGYWLDHFKDDLPYYMSLSIKGGNTVVLMINRNAVPEPSTWALMILGVAVLLLRKRVRN